MVVEAEGQPSSEAVAATLAACEGSAKRFRRSTAPRVCEAWTAVALKYPCILSVFGYCIVCS